MTIVKGLYLSPLFILLLVSCIPNKKVLYLQSQEAKQLPFDSLIEVSYPEYQLQVGDILNIEVKSSDPSITAIFQGSGNSGNMGNLAQGGADVNYLTGFPLNEAGYIELPLVGSLYLQGKTVEHSKDIIQDAIKQYILDAYVRVRLGGIRYTALGEFNRPGRYSILQSQVTIFEAIANAGDLSILADRQNALIIRQYPEGARIHQVNLTERELMVSEFYYIRPNDQIYLQPLPVRQFGGNLGVTGFQTLTGILSAVSSVLLVIVSLNRL